MILTDLTIAGGCGILKMRLITAPRGEAQTAQSVSRPGQSSKLARLTTGIIMADSQYQPPPQRQGGWYFWGNAETVT